MNKNIAGWVAICSLGLLLLIPTVFSLTWLVHLIIPMSFIELFWDITLASSIIGSLGIMMVHSRSTKTKEERRKINFYSELLRSLMTINLGIVILAGLFSGPLDALTDIAFGKYGMYLLVVMSGLLISVSLFSAGMHIRRYRS